MNEGQSNLVSRHWNGTPISRRTTDGYINATAMCKANGKKFANYFQNDSTALYLEALSSSVGIPAHELLQSKGGNGGGTWVHPNLAVELARWISPPFAVWMNQWFLEGAQQVQPAPVVPQLRQGEMLTLIERSADLFEKLGGLDERDQLLFKDMVRSNVLGAVSGSLPINAVDEEMTIGEAWMEVFQQPLPRGKGSQAGKLVAKVYRDEFEKEPPVRRQYVDGAPRKVNSYGRSWLINALQHIKTQLEGN